MLVSGMESMCEEGDENWGMFRLTANGDMTSIFKCSESCQWKRTWPSCSVGDVLLQVSYSLISRKFPRIQS